MKKADIALIGLAVMGENLVLNMESRGFTVAVYNRTLEKVDRFVSGRGAGKNIVPCHSLNELADALEKQHGIKVDKRKIDIGDPIRETGIREISVWLYSGVTTPMKLDVQPMKK